MNDTYDQQIEALLAEDYAEYKRLIGCPDPHREIVTHHKAWSNSGTYRRSIFAYLPQLSADTVNSACASMIEYLTPKNVNGELNIAPIMELKRLLLEDSGCVLPDLLEDDTAEHYRFSRAELEEFARRQRVARELP